MSSSSCMKLCWVSLECWSRKHPLITMVPSWCGLDAVLLRALSPSFSRKNNILSFLLQKQQSSFYTGWRQQQFGSEPVPALPRVSSGTKWGRFDQIFTQKQQKVFSCHDEKNVFLWKRLKLSWKHWKGFRNVNNIILIGAKLVFMHLDLYIWPLVRSHILVLTF